MQSNWVLFMQRIITGETWIHHYDHETVCITQQSMQWKQVTSPSPHKFKVQASAGRIMCIVIWDAESMLIDNMPQTNYALQLKKRVDSVDETYPWHPCFCMTIHLLTGHILDSLLLYGSAHLKKCAIHRTINVCSKRNIAVNRDFRPMMNSRIYATEEWLRGQSELRTGL